ncbi:hypothetical protein B0H14DRAFT_3165240 [Mycena olivaceomarginata]|nr:hypothetical protein B0H14DRAFT_3165240 [Mycena olivaceomarginata]
MFGCVFIFAAMCLVNSASATQLIRDSTNSTGSTNSTKLHVMSGCITVGALEVTLCAGTTNTTDLSGNTTIIYAFFNTSDTDDEYSLPGCHLDAHWPSNVSDIYFNDDCLTDGNTTIDGQCCRVKKPVLSIWTVDQPDIIRCTIICITVLGSLRTGKMGGKS